MLQLWVTLTEEVMITKYIELVKYLSKISNRIALNILSTNL